MKKLIALQITLILLLTAILSACSGAKIDDNPASDAPSQNDEPSVNNESSTPTDSSNGEELAENYVIHDKVLSVGSNQININTDYEYTLISFTPTEMGQYIITCNDSLIDLSYEDTAFGILTDDKPNFDNVKNNTISWNVDSDLIGWIAIKNSKETVIINVELKVEEFPVNREYFDLYNENAPEYTSNDRTHDYCNCGSVNYGSGYEYNLSFGVDKDFILDYGYATEEEYQAYVERVNEVDYANADTVLETGWTSPPPLYRAIKEFNIKKEDYLEHREEQYQFYLETGIAAEEILSEREIEILFGDYDLETVMRELKGITNYYYNGGIFTPDNLYRVSDELLKEMMKEDDFYLYLFDMENLGVKNPSERVEALKAEMEEE